MGITEAARWAGELMTKSLAEACGITVYKPPRRLVREHVTVRDTDSEQTLRCQMLKAKRHLSICWNRTLLPNQSFNIGNTEFLSSILRQDFKR